MRLSQLMVVCYRICTKKRRDFFFFLVKKRFFDLLSMKISCECYHAAIDFRQTVDNQFCCSFKQVTRLCDLSADGNSVTSVSWSERGNQVAVGTHHGYVTVWDVTVNKQVQNLHLNSQYSNYFSFLSNNLLPNLSLLWSNEVTINTRSTFVI